MPEDTQRKLLDMIAREEIKSIPHKFARGLDRCERALIESCFHPDGIDDHGFFRGNAEEFCDWVLEELKKYDASQHIIGTQNVELSGDTAFCESYFIAVHMIPNPKGATELIVAGRYLDTMENRDGDWKITLRRCVFDWNRMTDALPIPPRDPDPRCTGTRYPEDESYSSFFKR